LNTRSLAALIVLFSLGGCNRGSDHAVTPRTGGASGGSTHGGTSGTAGVNGSGGMVSTGGASTEGSSSRVDGGRATSGGALGSGGRTTAGGAGGTVGTGGFGGSLATGGVASGGIPGTGGGGTAGVPGTGGTRTDAAPDGPPDVSLEDVGVSRDAIRDQAHPQDPTFRDESPADRPSADAPSPTSDVFKPAFILGADVTITVEDEHWDATYTDNGQKKSVEQILKDHGFNFIRIDTFVEPGASGGYAADKPEPFRDLAHTITFAKRVKKIGMGFMLDFHYSDTWTNPGAQATPAAWAGLSLSALETKVYDYTKDAINQLKSQGAMPDMVSVGNEITNGMLWDTGRISNSNFANFATLLKAGIRATREVDPAIVIVMHLEKCNNYTTTKWWLDGVLKQGVSFDVLGQSCYAKAPNGVAAIQGTPADWKSTFGQLATAYPDLKFLIAEYSAEQRAAGDVMFGLPDKRGIGTFNWDPTRSYDTLPNDPLFSTNGAWNRYVAIPEKMALYEQMAKDYGARMSSPRSPAPASMPRAFPASPQRSARW
jgi:arabinogalactan endo-1,4-beta-galactosidase